MLSSLDLASLKNIFIIKINLTKRGWIIRIHRINEQDLDFYLPVFVFVFTKMKMKISPQNPVNLIEL